MNTDNIYERITDRIITMLETHKTSGYKSAWYSNNEFAQNIVSKHQYSGINQVLLQDFMLEYKYKLNYWMTFKQLSDLGGKIVKGSKAAMIIFKSNLYFDKKDSKNITKLVSYTKQNGGNIEQFDYKKLSYIKKYNIFNVGQIENLPDEFYKPFKIENLTEFEKDEKAELLINSVGVEIEYIEGDDAFYSSSTDTIQLPERKQFNSKQDFYNTIFHELAHASGAKHRLNRKLGSKFGSVEYTQEELIAELTTAYLNAHFGFSGTITDNVDYINNWLSILQHDKKFVVLAASKAQKATDYILEFAKVKQLETV